jgi:hypothetical protein
MPINIIHDDEDYFLKKDYFVTLIEEINELETTCIGSLVLIFSSSDLRTGSYPSFR